MSPEVSTTAPATGTIKRLLPWLVAVALPQSLRENPAALIHGVHQAFIVLGVLTMASSVVFLQLRRDDGGAISRHKG